MKRTFVIHSRIKCLATKEGETIEEKMRKVTMNNEPIDNTAPLIYTEKKDGCLPQYDHRTDRFEIARAAKDRVSATYLAMSAEKQAQAEAAAKAVKEGKVEGEA